MLKLVLAVNRAHM